jgi:hypothetical protein
MSLSEVRALQSALVSENERYREIDTKMKQRGCDEENISEQVYSRMGYLWQGSGQGRLIIEGGKLSFKN